VLDAVGIKELVEWLEVALVVAIEDPPVDGLLLHLAEIVGPR
jgi:hypothetical protein